MSFLIKNFFLPQIPEAITFFKVKKFSMFQLILVDWNQNNLWYFISQVDLTTLGGVRAKTKKVRWESGVSEAKIEIAYF